jgi:hypothetical protein
MCGPCGGVEALYDTAYGAMSATKAVRRPAHGARATGMAWAMKEQGSLM